MKYKVGDKVQYDSGDWLFYGTVTAVIENSINPCYRLNVDRMVKKNCKFSITQFEFELESDMEVENLLAEKAWEQSEIEYLKKYFSAQPLEELPQGMKPEPVPEYAATSEPTPEKFSKRRMKRNQEQEQGNVELLQMPTSDVPKRRRNGVWDINFELYKTGEKGPAINTWIANNRRQYKIGKLKADKYNQLMEINFPFEASKKRGTKKKRHQRRITGKKI